MFPRKRESTFIIIIIFPLHLARLEPSIYRSVTNRYIFQHRKIDNFIRTKYESRRWIMDGPMPDPSTLDDGDDDVVC